MKPAVSHALTALLSALIGVCAVLSIPDAPAPECPPCPQAALGQGEGDTLIPVPVVAPAGGVAAPSVPTP